MSIPKRPKRDIENTTSLPLPPDWFDEDRADLYYKLGKQIVDMKFMEKTDVQAYIILVDNLAIYHQSAAKVAEEGSTTSGREGTTVRHPAVIMKNTAWKIIQPLLVQFGLTPSARTSMGIQKETSSVMDGLLPKKED